MDKGRELLKALRYFTGLPINDFKDILKYFIRGRTQITNRQDIQVTEKRSHLNCSWRCCCSQDDLHYAYYFYQKKKLDEGEITKEKWCDVENIDYEKPAFLIGSKCIVKGLKDQGMSKSVVNEFMRETCVVCWSKPAKGKEKLFCSKECKEQFHKSLEHQNDYRLKIERRLTDEAE